MAAHFPPAESDEMVNPAVRGRSGLSATASGRAVATSTTISLATIAVVAAALLVYISGSFVLAEITGVKRYSQVALIIPIGVAASYYLVYRPRCVVDPLIGFVIVKTATEIALRRNWLDTSDDLATLLALIVVYSAPSRSVEKGCRFLVSLAGIFAVMAIVQWLVLFVFPELANYRLRLTDAGALENTVMHPIALLGLTTGEQYTFLGHPVSRLQSFAKEPSLNVVYFLIPACLAFLTRTRLALMFGTVMLVFCVLSFSGSVYLSLVFAAIWWILLRFVSVRFALLYGTLIVLGAYAFVLQRLGLDSLLSGMAYITQYGDFFEKTRSLSVRAGGAAANINDAWSSPFGSSILSDTPAPWPIDAVLAAGWLGAILLFFFVRNIAFEIEALNHNFRGVGTRLATLLLLALMTTVIVFNDYQMSNYSGLLLMAFVYRTIRSRNEASGPKVADTASGAKA